MEEGGEGAEGDAEATEEAAAEEEEKEEKKKIEKKDKGKKGPGRIDMLQGESWLSIMTGKNKGAQIRRVTLVGGLSQPHFSVHSSLNQSELTDYHLNMTVLLIISDRKSDQRLRTVVLGPITLGDLDQELIKEHIGRCVQYFLRMHLNEENGEHDG